MRFVRPLLLAVALACPVIALRAQSPDEQYIRIYQIIQEADRLNDAGQKRPAAAKYMEAQDALKRFQMTYQGWNDRVINYWLNYVATKLGPLSAFAAAPAPATNAPAPAEVVSPGEASMRTSNPPVAVVPPTSAPSNAPPSAPPTPAPAPAAPAAPAGPSPEVLQQIAALQAEVEKLRSENNRLGAENNRLGAKLKEALSVQPAAVDPRELAKAEDRIRVLEKQNELLQVRLTMATNAVPVAPPVSDAALAELKAKIAEQNDTVAALRAENEILKKRERETASKPAAAALAAPAAAPTSGPAAQELQALRARVATLEAKPLPFSPEELALMSSPAALNAPSTLVASAATPGNKSTTPPPAEGAPKKVSRELPPGAGPLFQAAIRAFAAREYADSEAKLTELLRQDENNVDILANLASAQLQTGHVEEADRNVRKALSLDPSDYFALYILGRVYVRQDKLDDALDTLNRSIASKSDYPDAYNLLGIVLSEKGLRVPAEAALRRALQLDPNNPLAHNNLAVIYAYQTPPALALARWHYQRALQAGHGRNPDLEKVLDGQK